MKQLLARLAGRNRTAPGVHSCEICSTEGVTRSGNWDYCPRGHVYVGRRADEPDATSTTHPDTALLYRSLDART